MMRPDQERVRNLLTDTVTLLCKNGLQFNKELKVQGLLGITTDENDVFVVHINEKFGEVIGSTSITVQKAESPQQSEGFVDLTERDHSRRKRRKRRSFDSDSSPSYQAQSPEKSSSSGIDSVSIKIKKEERGSSSGCSERDRSQRHSHKSGDDRDAMRETYSGLSLSDIQSGFEFDAISREGVEGTNGSTGTPSKRRAYPPSASRPPDDGESPASGPFITGIARHSEKALDSAANVSWDNSALDELSHMTGDSSMDETAGCSTWGSSQTMGELQGVPLPPGTDDSSLNDILSEFQSSLSPSVPPVSLNLRMIKFLIKDTTGMQSGQATFVLNKLCDIVFTRDELAFSSGLGRKQPLIPSSRVPLDKSKIVALYNLLNSLCLHCAWEPLEQAKFNRKLNVKVTNVRRYIRSMP